MNDGEFASPLPADAGNPVALDFKMALGTTYVTLSVLNARLLFLEDAFGQNGQVNGSIPHSDIVNKFQPAMAETCNDAIQNAPSSDTATSCKSLFDTGCSGFPEYANDSQIEICEINENALLQGVLGPDVMVEDGGTLVEANSVGFRFTAIAYQRVFANGFEP